MDVNLSRLLVEKRLVNLKIEGQAHVAGDAGFSVWKELNILADEGCRNERRRRNSRCVVPNLRRITWKTAQHSIACRKLLAINAIHMQRNPGSSKFFISIAHHDT